MNSRPKDDTRFNISGFIAIILFLGMLVFLTIVMQVNERSQDELAEKKINAELLLSEKLNEVKRGDILQSAVEKLKKTRHLDSANAERFLQQRKELELRLEQQFCQIRVYQAKLLKNERDASMLQKPESKTKMTDDELLLIKSLQSKNDSLSSALAEQVMTSFQYIDELERLARLRIVDVVISTEKKNGRLTAKSSKARLLRVNLEISDQVYYPVVRLFNPTGEEVKLDASNSSIAVTNIALGNQREVFADSTLRISATAQLKHLVLTIRSSKGFMPGKYSLLVYDNDEPMGSLALILD